MGDRRGGLAATALVAALVAVPTVPVLAQQTEPQTEPPAPPALALAPEAVAFGDVAVGDEERQTVTASNVGGGTLTIASVDLDDDAAFAVADDGCSGQTLPSGAECRVDIAFTPDAVAERDALLVVLPDDPTGVRRVVVSGTGTDPAAPTPQVGVPGTAARPPPPSAVPWVVAAGLAGAAVLVLARLRRRRSARWVARRVDVRAMPDGGPALVVELLDDRPVHRVRVVAQPDRGTTTVDEVVP